MLVADITPSILVDSGLLLQPASLPELPRGDGQHAQLLLRRDSILRGAGHSCMISASDFRQQLLHSVQHQCHPFTGAPHFHFARMATWQDRTLSSCLTVEHNVGFLTSTALVSHELAMIAGHPSMVEVD